MKMLNPTECSCYSGLFQAIRFHQNGHDNGIIAFMAKIIATYYPCLNNRKLRIKIKFIEDLNNR
ncbi:hypothetical protein YY63_25380 [Salmonella enterica subsp. enterica]|nr:hypothetical protein [Salmonella enterica subsp. enterica serovar Oranienburg]